MRKKQIEEMAVILTDGGCTKCNCDENGKFNCLPMYNAELLYNAGYRKQSEVVDEFVKQLKEEPIKLSLPLFDLSTKDEIEEHFNDIMIEVRDAIDHIAKEMLEENNGIH